MQIISCLFYVYFTDSQIFTLKFTEPLIYYSFELEFLHVLKELTLLPRVLQQKADPFLKDGKAPTFGRTGGSYPAGFRRLWQGDVTRCGLLNKFVYGHSWVVFFC